MGKNNREERIKYNLPVFGGVEIKLDPLSCKFFVIMNENKEIDRLGNLLHLGVLQNDFPGTRHTRWDYTMANLFVIEKMVECEALEGIRGERKIRGKKLTAKDILQLLALLNSIGHLPGTFATEKAILKYLIKNNELYQNIMSQAGINIKNRGLSIDYINFNKILALIKLNLWLEKEESAQNKETIEVCIELIKRYLSHTEQTEWFKKVFDYYSFSRRIAYQLYDSLYISVPLKIEYVQFLQKFPQLLKDLGSWKVLREILDSYTRIIYRYIYNADLSRKSSFYYIQCLISEKTGKNELNADFILKILNEYNILECNVSNSNVWERIISLEIGKEVKTIFLIEDLREYGLEKLENEFEMKNKSSQMLTFYIPGIKDPFLESPSGEINIDIWTKKHEKHEKLTIILKSFIFFYNKFKKKTGIGVLLKNLIEQFLKHLPNESISSVDVNLYPIDFFSSCEYSTAEEDEIFSIFKNVDKRKALSIFRRLGRGLKEISKAKFHECKSFKSLLNRIWKKEKGRFYILLPGEIRFKKDKEDLCEFDGGIISYFSHHGRIKEIEIYLMEAKSGKKGRNSEKALKMKIRELKLEAYTYKIMPIKGNISEAFVLIKFEKGVLT